jgi:hypothetical protein
VEATHKAFPPAQPIQMGVSASQQPPLPEQTRHVLETTLKILIHAMGHVRSVAFVPDWSFILFL